MPPRGPQNPTVPPDFLSGGLGSTLLAGKPLPSGFTNPGGFNFPANSRHALAALASQPNIMGQIITRSGLAGQGGGTETPSPVAAAAPTGQPNVLPVQNSTLPSGFTRDQPQAEIEAEIEPQTNRGAIAQMLWRLFGIDEGAAANKGETSNQKIERLRREYDRLYGAIS